MNGVGYLGAFLGGLLSLLSPCGALLLPGFFAYAFPSRRRLFGRTALFYLGLVVVLVPLGMGSAAASRLVYGHRTALATVAGALLVLFGLMQVSGRGFPFGVVSRSVGGGRGDSAPAILVLGMTSGVAGFCSGPILGAVLTVAAASGRPVLGAALLAVYGLGMAAPLFGLALAWDRLGVGSRRWLRGRGVRVGPLRLHTTTAISGVIFLALGVLFLVERDSGGLGGFFAPPGAEGLHARLTDAVVAVSDHVPDLVLLGVLAAVVVAVTAWRLRRTGTGEQMDADPVPERESAVRDADPL